MPFKLGYTYKSGEATLVLDGTEQTLYEFPAGSKAVIELYVDLTPMQAGDTITVKEYMINQSSGAYVEYGSETYSGVQTIKMLHITPKPSTHGLKVTMQQTAGVMRTIPYQYFVEYR
jgi:hypothetical protein